MKISVVKLVNIKIAVCEKTAGLRELFGFEFSVLESASSRKNISDLRHMLNETEQYTQQTV